MSKRKTEATLFHELPPAAQKKVLKNLKLDIEVDFIPLSAKGDTRIRFSEMSYYQGNINYLSTYAEVINVAESLPTLFQICLSQ